MASYALHMPTRVAHAKPPGPIMFEFLYHLLFHRFITCLYILHNQHYNVHVHDLDPDGPLQVDTGSLAFKYRGQVIIGDKAVVPYYIKDKYEFTSKVNESSKLNL